MVYTILLYQIGPKSQDLLYDLTEFRNYMCICTMYICVFYFIIMIVLSYVFYSNNVLPLYVY